MLNPITRAPYTMNGTVYTQYWAVWPVVIGYDYAREVKWLAYYYSYWNHRGERRLIGVDEYLRRMINTY